MRFPTLRQLTVHAFSLATAFPSFAFAFSYANLSVLRLSQIGFISVLIIIAISHRRHTFSAYNLIAWYVTTFSLYTNLLVNVGNYGSESVTFEFAITHITILACTMFLIQWSTSNLDIETVIPLIAIYLAPLCVAGCLYAAMTSGMSLRAVPFDVHPNWWGEIGFSLIVCALAIQARAIRLLLLSTGIVLLILVQSRGAMLASGVAIVIYSVFVFATRWHPTIKKMLFLLLSIAFLLFVVSTFFDRFLRLLDLVAENILLLDDRYRGLGTELVGRLDGWNRALETFYSNTLFGYGIDTMHDVHNGFLRLAAEGGLIVFLPVTLLILVAVLDSLRKKQVARLCILFGYCILVLTYPRMLNLSIASIVFFISLFSWPTAARGARNTGRESRRDTTPFNRTRQPIPR